MARFTEKEAKALQARCGVKRIVGLGTSGDVPAPRRKKAKPAKNRAKLKESEAKFQKSVCKLLDNIGLENLYSVTDASLTFGFDGRPRTKVRKSWPDITGVLFHNGQMFVIEVKTINGVFQDGQPEMHERLRNAGACVIVPRQLEDVARGILETGFDHPILRGLLGSERRA